MFSPLRQLLRQRPSRNLPSIPAGERFYAVGDVHGRYDLFARAIEEIEADDAARPAADTTVVLLGDLIDRGPESAQVLRAARKWGKTRKVRILAGNHEEMFLESFDDAEVLRHFVRHGGRETILSFGLTKAEYNALSVKQLQARLHEIVPDKLRRFVQGFEDYVEAGDYLFVHAGVDPSRPLAEQKRTDMLWIRERFLNHRGAWSHTVVHGHTIFDGIELGSHRIGIDTGAFRSGRLTTLVLEGAARDVITVASGKKRIAVEKDALTA